MAGTGAEPERCFSRYTAQSASLSGIGPPGVPYVGVFGRAYVDFYVLTDTIQGNATKFTVNVKLVGDDPKNTVIIETYEFRRNEGVWCAYPVKDVYVPVSTHVNDMIVNIFEVCRQYTNFITLSEKDVKAKEAKKFFDRGTDYYFKDKNYNLSADCFTRAINLYPEYYEAYIRRARAYFAKGDYDSAISDYRHVLNAGKDDYGIAKNELNDVIKAKQKRGY